MLRFKSEVQGPDRIAWAFRWASKAGANTKHKCGVMVKGNEIVSSPSVVAHYRRIKVRCENNDDSSGEMEKATVGMLITLSCRVARLALFMCLGPAG